MARSPQDVVLRSPAVARMLAYYDWGWFLLSAHWGQRLAIGDGALRRAL